MDYTTERVLGKDPRRYCVGLWGAEITTEPNIGINVVDGDGIRGFARPGEEAHTTGVMDLGSNVGTLAAQPLAKPFDFWKHPTPPGGGMVMILSPGGKLEDLRRTDWHLP